MSKILQQDYQEYSKLIEEGHSQRSACLILGLNRSTMQNYLKKIIEEEELDEYVANMRQGESCGYFEPKKSSFAEVCSNVANAIGNIGKAMSGESNLGKEPLYKFDLDFKKTILVVADTQAKPTESLEYMLWIGKYIADVKPDIIVHIGDHYDMPSLSSYDKGKASAEGRRFVDDLNAGNKGLELLNLVMHKDPTYEPRKVFCKGNHCHRIDRYVEDNPELKGTLGTEFLPLEDYGWEVHDFLKPVEIEGIFFVHYLSNPMNGRPYSGTASSILKTVGKSFVVGHKQVLDIAIRPTIDGKQQIGIVNGACYPFDEGYKGYQGNNHFRGVTLLTEVQDGFGLPSFISLQHLKQLYYS